jgi:transcriptional regulator with XRE-family HTH domain
MAKAPPSPEKKRQLRDFGRWISRRREDEGLTQERVRAKVGISQVQLSRIENGESGTRPETVMKLARAIPNTSVAEALWRAGFAAPQDPAADAEYDQSLARLIVERSRKYTQPAREQIISLLEMVNRECDRLELESRDQRKGGRKGR